MQRFVEIRLVDIAKRRKDCLAAVGHALRSVDIERVDTVLLGCIQDQVKAIRNRCCVWQRTRLQLHHSIGLGRHASRRGQLQPFAASSRHILGLGGAALRPGNVCKTPNLGRCAEELPPTWRSTSPTPRYSSGTSVSFSNVR
jgi:hypothetical protein